MPAGQKESRGSSSRRVSEPPPLSPRKTSRRGSNGAATSTRMTFTGETVTHNPGSSSKRSSERRQRRSDLDGSSHHSKRLSQNNKKAKMGGKRGSSHKNHGRMSSIRNLFGKGKKREGSDDEEKSADQMREAVEEALEFYPKHLCTTFADHQEFAMAELTTRQSKLHFHLTRENLAELKGLLRVRLQERLRGSNREERRPSRSPGPSPRPMKPSLRSSMRSASMTSLPVYQETGGDDTSTSSEEPSKPASSPLFTIKSSPIGVDATTTTTRRPSSLRSFSEDSASFAVSRDAPTKSRDASTKSRDASIKSRDASIKSRDSAESSKTLVRNLRVMDASDRIGDYTGSFSEESGLPHGMGKMVYRGDYIFQSYEGNWDQGRWSGSGGKLTKKNGDTYDGGFFNDAMHGQGTYTYSKNARRFQGRYVMGERVSGTMYYSDKSFYEGAWSEGQRHGKGSYLFSDGSTYKGDFFRDRIHGYGQLLWPDGSKYVGEWNNGQRHGTGKEYTKQGTVRFDGRWKNGKPVRRKAPPPNQATTPSDTIVA